MTIPAWPATLPDELLMRGYSESMADNTLRTGMDVGPAKLRRRATTATYPIAGQQIMDATELGYLKTFYGTTLLSGSRRFSWTDPIGGGAIELRFTSPPSWGAAGGLNYWVDLAFEVMP